MSMKLVHVPRGAGSAVEAEAGVAEAVVEASAVNLAGRQPGKRKQNKEAGLPPAFSFASSTSQSSLNFPPVNSAIQQ
jgi:hypothetical protein